MLTGTALFFRTLLAVTGNGSWADVAVDVVALATLGVGGGISGTAGLVGRAGRTLDEAVEVGDWIVTAEEPAKYVVRAWHPVIILGGLLATFGNFAACVFYLYKVLGTATGWLLATFPLIIANVGVGSVTIAGTATTVSAQHPGGVKTLATASWWIAGACLAVALAVTVALAVANGERWMRRNGGNLPRNKFEAYVRPRGTLARLWLPG